MKEPGTKLSTKNFWAIAVNSTTTFFLAYLLVYYINFFLRVAMAAVFNYPVNFTYNKINYFIQSYEWTHDSVRLIYSSGPLVLLVFGVLSLVIYASMSEEEGRMKTFFIWFTMHAFNFVFSGLMIGNIFTHGIGHVFNWMYLHDTTKMIVALVGFFGLLLTAILVTKPIESSAVSYFNKLNDKNIPFFITAQVIVPYVIGSLLVIGYFFPLVSFQVKYSWIVLGVLIMIIVGRVNYMEPLVFDVEEKHISVSWPSVIFTLAIALLVHYLLSTPRSFGM
jgi:hypothetical protein